MALAEFMGEPQPDWELAADQLGHVIAAHPEAFADKSRFSMDWYYPVLGGPVRGDAARNRIASRWAEFVVPDLGIRCVSDEPWITGAETCELVLALDAIGEIGEALGIYASVQHLRDESGAYWTGWQFANQQYFPAERSSWTAAAVVLAADALARATGGADLFHMAAGADVGGLPAAAEWAAGCGCAEAASYRATIQLSIQLTGQPSIQLSGQPSIQLSGQPMPSPVRRSTRSEPCLRTSVNAPDASARR